ATSRSPMKMLAFCLSSWSDRSSRFISSRVDFAMSKRDLPPLAAIDPAEAWKPWKPDDANPWDLKWAGHVYRRLAFSPTWAESQQALRDGHEATLERL